MNKIDPTINQMKFTKKEDIYILESLLKLGLGKWHEIASRMNSVASEKDTRRNEI